MRKKSVFQKEKSQKNLRIGLLTSVINRPSLTPLSNFIDILSHITPELFLITGNEGFRNFKHDTRVQTFGYNYVIERSRFLKICNFLLGQLRCSYFVIRLSKKVDFWIFFTGGEFLVLPLFIARLLNKPVSLYIPGSLIRDSEFLEDSLVFVTKYLSKITRKYADHIIIYSENLIQEWNLQKYHKKIIVAHRHFLDFNRFQISIPFLQRSITIGYIGRLSGEKGIYSFILALPAILQTDKSIQVMICGDGPLKEEIEDILTEQHITGRVRLFGWVLHEDLPEYLNQMKLLVIPSYTEGLPNIMLEAMACGTPVLVTPVGAIPDIIKDGETGIIMENNTPKCITETVMRTLNSPDLEKIAENGRQFVEENFTFEKTVDKWKKILITFKK